MKVNSLLLDETVDLQTKIRTQIEFYFSDENLSRDKHLWKLIKSNHNVPIDELLKFNKLKEILLKFHSKDKHKAIVKALELSETVKVTDDWSSIWRWWRFCINEKLENKLNKRKVYVEGYPPNATPVQIAKIFSKVGFISDISMPWYCTSSKARKGYAFITYETED